jgi:hypothetical protein
MEFHYRDWENHPTLTVKVDDSPLNVYMSVGNVLASVTAGRQFLVRLDTEGEAHVLDGDTCVSFRAPGLPSVMLDMTPEVVRQLAAVMPVLLENAERVKPLEVEHAPVR